MSERPSDPGIIFRGRESSVPHWEVSPGAEQFKIGRVVARQRRRRGMSQEVLSGLVGRSADWLSKVENGRIPLDRVSVIEALATALKVPVSELFAGTIEVAGDSGTTTDGILGIRAALSDYQLALPETHDDVEVIATQVNQLWTACQNGRHDSAFQQFPHLLRKAQGTALAAGGGDRRRAKSLVAMIYHAAEFSLTKMGDPKLAWLAADRGLTAAKESEDPAVVGSLLRAVSHSLLSDGQLNAAKQLVVQAADYLQPGLRSADEAYWSVYGTLFLGGAVAAARSQDHESTRTFLAEAQEATRFVDSRSNHLWTSFGSANLDIHRVATAVELGDLQQAMELGPRVDLSNLPIERRVRHSLETARAFDTAGRRADALEIIVRTERSAPTQVREHFISRELVSRMVRTSRRQPGADLAGLVSRMRLVID